MKTMTTREAIGLANERFMKTFAAGDAAGVAQLYTADGQVLPPQSDPITGRKGIEAFWRAVIGMGVAAAKLETVELFDHGDAAYEVGRYVLAAASGQPLDHGKYLVAWRLEDGEWRLHRDIWNTSVAPAA